MKQTGFSFVELLVVLAMLASLAAIAVPPIQHAMQRQREAQLRNALHEIRSAIDAYKRARERGQIKRAPGVSLYPPDLQTLVDGVPDQQSPDRRMLRFLRQLPRDPFADPDWPAASTWAQRASTSPPDVWDEGDDVFDVASRSSLTGLNGVPLAQW
ncbi:type II secretion system protein [Massilia sp. W12]|uniref:type II secretion system protein n=1 Tax=Massilia sp. W12 TaxID=3126507 RepID=UPI0030CC23F7